MSNFESEYAQVLCINTVIDNISATMLLLHLKIVILG